MKPAVLVAGAAGYIGSHTCKALATSGYLPIGFDNLSRGHLWAAKWGPLVQSDIGDGDALRTALQVHSVSAVIHFAADALVGESMVKPRHYFRNNLANTLTLLEAMQDVGVKHIVFSSTCATYGIPSACPIHEDMPQLPVNPYGESKLFVERVLRWYDLAYDLRSVALRYFNASGADPDGELGEDHDPETHLIPLAIEAALGHRAAIDIYGTDYPTADGTAIRDYVHVTDLANAHVIALEYLLNGGPTNAFNLGTGHGSSVRQVIDAVERIGGSRVPVREASRRPGDPPVLVADPAKACAVLGWTPQWSQLDTIVATALAWRRRRDRAPHLVPATASGAQ